MSDQSIQSQSVQSSQLVQPSQPQTVISWGDEVEDCVEDQAEELKEPGQLEESRPGQPGQSSLSRPSNSSLDGTRVATVALPRKWMDFVATFVTVPVSVKETLTKELHTDINAGNVSPALLSLILTNISTLSFSNGKKRTAAAGGKQARGGKPNRGRGYRGESRGRGGGSKGCDGESRGRDVTSEDVKPSRGREGAFRGREGAFRGRGGASRGHGSSQ